jgi:ketosteroid isomerase-like protein
VSRENVETVRRWFERLAAGDPAPELCDPEIEIRNWSESPNPGPYRGHGGLDQWFREVNDPEAATEIQMFELKDATSIDDERVLTTQRAHGRARYTGVEADFLWSAIITVRQGRILSAFGYPTPEEAKEAAG